MSTTIDRYLGKQVAQDTRDATINNMLDRADVCLKKIRKFAFDEIDDMRKDIGKIPVDENRRIVSMKIPATFQKTLNAAFGEIMRVLASF